MFGVGAGGMPRSTARYSVVYSSRYSVDINFLNSVSSFVYMM